MRKLLVVLPLIGSLVLSGCSAFKTFEGAASKEEAGYSNAYDLPGNKAYVWNDPEAEDIRDDLLADREGEAVFFPCPMGDTNFKGEEITDYEKYKRSIWFSDGADEAIPTVTGKNALIYISDTTVPKEIVLERFADYGYTIGISNMVPDGGGHYYIVYAETDEDDYKYYIDLKSDCKELTEFKTIERLYLDKVGGMEVRKESVSEGGTVLGLTKDKSYICEFYTGTFYQDFKLKANVRSFGSLEKFILYDYDFLHANCIRINIPDWLKSGYYFVQGAGLFRYVSEEDEGKFDGSCFDPGIDWNDPIKLYDEYGVCIFDPSLGIGLEEEETEPEEELTAPEEAEEETEGSDEVEHSTDGSDST